MIRSLSLGVVAAAALLVGCQAKLSVSKSYTLPDEGSIDKILEMPQQANAQTLTITVKVKTGDPIDVFVVKAEDVSGTIALKNDEKKGWEQKGLGFKREMKNDSFTVKIPANVTYKVVAMQSDSAKMKTEFDLKVTN